MLLACAIEDKPVTMTLSEYQILQDQWYTDLECLLKNNVQSETIRKTDILKVITATH